MEIKDPYAREVVRVHDAINFFGKHEVTEELIKAYENEGCPIVSYSLAIRASEIAYSENDAERAKRYEAIAKKLANKI
jgi:hypothetical protein